MSFFDILKGSLATLKANKLRTLLTMLGIIIGISSVIAMWAIGNGGRDSILGDLKKVGYGKFTVTIDYKNENFKYKDYFTMENIDMLKNSHKFKAVSINVEDAFRMLKDNEPYYSYGTVTTEDYEKISPVTMTSGRNFLPFEYTSNERVIILDSMSARKLFADEKLSLGQTVEITKDRKKTGHSYKKNILEFNKNVKDLYLTQTVSSDIESFDKILSTLSLFVTMAASISLLVGGIGVMNIMLVTVVERTKEIGIRKALGAKNRDILKQFLFESIILTVFGGLVGMGVGVLFGFLAGAVMGIKPIFSLTSIIVSLSISIIVGVIFGVSPARRAAKLNPIDALRTE